MSRRVERKRTHRFWLISRADASGINASGRFVLDAAGQCCLVRRNSNRDRIRCPSRVRDAAGEIAGVTTLSPGVWRTEKRFDCRCQYTVSG